MSQTECPKCHALQARRVKQEGFIQKAILQKLGFFPWECRFCKSTFVLKNRGHGKADKSEPSRTKQVNNTTIQSQSHTVSGVRNPL
jgi:phage FluMu protein Com